MSAWYVLSALGFYPLCAGHPSWVFGSPLFEHAELRLAGGRTVVLEAETNGPGRPFVREITRDGSPHRDLWIGYDPLTTTDRLRFTMAAEPEPRALGPAQLPFSVSGA